MTDDNNKIAITDNSTETTPPQAKRKTRSDKGKKRGARKTVDHDIKISLKYILLKATEGIAQQTGNPFITMTDNEAENIDKAIDVYIEKRIPTLKEYPETILLVPVLNYVARVSIQTAMNKNKKPIDKQITQPIEHSKNKPVIKDLFNDIEPDTTPKKIHKPKIEKNVKVVHSKPASVKPKKKRGNK